MEVKIMKGETIKPGNQTVLDARIKAYLTDRIKIALQEDFALIEDTLPQYIQRYNLKQLIIILKLEADKRKRTPLT